MKPIIRLLALTGLYLAVAFSVGGCSTAARTIEASSTEVRIQTGKNKGMSITLPKELDTTGLHVNIDPKNGVIKLDADKLKSSSQGIIESAGVAQAQAMASMSATLNTALSSLLPILAKAATGLDVPALPAPEPAPEPAPAPLPRRSSTSEGGAPVVTPIAPIEIPLLGAR